MTPDQKAKLDALLTAVRNYEPPVNATSEVNFKALPFWFPFLLSLLETMLPQLFTGQLGQIVKLALEFLKSFLNK